MPEFTVKVYDKPVVIPSVQLEVKNDLPEPHEPARQLRVEPSSTNVFMGEAFNVKVLLPATSNASICCSHSGRVHGRHMGLWRILTVLFVR